MTRETTDEPPPAAIADAGETRIVAAGEGDAGERLDRMLAARLGDFSRSRLKQLILERHVARADGAIGPVPVTDPSLRVRPGERFAVTLPPPVADRPEAQAIPLEIRFEDDHVLVIDKPAGLVVHPAPGNPDQTLVNALLAHCGDSLAGIGGVRRPGIVHRLDKDTSGLMVIAKSARAHTALAEDFAAHRIRRAYKAVVWGVPSPRQGEIVGNIGRSPSNRKKMAVVAKGGKSALTRYSVLRTFKTVAALVECRLATGRTHQIRVHMTEKGHPLIGDPTYGTARGGRRSPALNAASRQVIDAFPRQALHAYELGFTHPASGESLRFLSELPKDIAQLIGILDEL